jgi:tRNA threonylcarbamoyladenosine biosynthesis protein TsaB
LPDGSDLRSGLGFVSKVAVLSEYELRTFVHCRIVDSVIEVYATSLPSNIVITRIIRFVQRNPMQSSPSNMAGTSADQTLLALETVGRAGSVALSRGEHLVASLDTPPEFGSAKTLAATINKLMKQEEVGFQELSAIAVTVGPGSFTGLRVGVATAKALAFALKIPTVSVDSLEAMAKAIRTPIDVEAWTILDAYRSELFVAKWSIQANETLQYKPGAITRVIPTIPTRLMAIRDWLELAHESSMSSNGCCFVGPGLLRIDDETAKKLGGDSSGWNSDLAPTAVQVAELGWEKFVRGEFASPFELMPRYFRGSAAEEAKRDDRLSD